MDYVNTNILFVAFHNNFDEILIGIPREGNGRGSMVIGSSGYTKDQL